MYRIYLSKIKEALKKRLKGTITVTLVDDTLIISLYNPVLNFQQTYYGLSDKICAGCPAGLYANDFISHYKQAIHRACFKDKR